MIAAALSVLLPMQTPQPEVIASVECEKMTKTHNRMYLNQDTKKWERHNDPLWAHYKKIDVLKLPSGEMQLRIQMQEALPKSTKAAMGIQVCFSGGEGHGHRDLAFAFGRSFTWTEPSLAHGEAGLVSFEKGRKAKPRTVSSFGTGNAAYVLTQKAKTAVQGDTITITFDGAEVGYQKPFHMSIHYKPGIRAAHVSGDFGDSRQHIMFEERPGQVMLHRLF